jgi:hypothetical protein
MIAAVVGAPAPRHCCPGPLVYAAATVNSFAHWLTGRRASGSVLTKENVPLILCTLYYDQSKGERELGFSETSLYEAIQETHEWCLRCGQ